MLPNAPPPPPVPRPPEKPAKACSQAVKTPTPGIPGSDNHQNIDGYPVASAAEADYECAENDASDSEKPEFRPTDQECRDAKTRDNRRRVEAICRVLMPGSDGVKFRADFDFTDDTAVDDWCRLQGGEWGSMAKVKPFDGL